MGLIQSVPATVFIQPKSRIILVLISSIDQHTSFGIGVELTVKTDLYEDRDICSRGCIYASGSAAID